MEKKKRIGSKGKAVIAFSQTGNQVFVSIAAAAKEYGVTPPVLKRFIDKGQNYKGNWFDMLVE